MLTTSSLAAALGVLALACSGDARNVDRGATPAIAPPVAAGSQAPVAATSGTRLPRAVLDPSLPLQIESLGTQIKSSRAWTSAISPNPRGGWNLITQTYEHKSDLPPEFVVLDLQSGAYSVFETEPGAYVGQKYQHAKQNRAKNGRIFFPMHDVRMAYYDPADESIKELGRLIDPPGDQTFLYSMAFGPDGKLYIGSQSRSRPVVVQLDPDTLKTRVLGPFGTPRKNTAFAYHLAIDPPWLYVTVGQMPWELVAHNMKTGETRTLETRDSNPWMALQLRPEGVLAELVTGLRTPQQKKELVWCVDGKTQPYDRKPKRDVQPLDGKLPEPPQLDLTALNPDHRGVGRARWKTAKMADWATAEYRIHHVTPVEIESLAALPDGTLLGSSKQYHGYFRYDPRTNDSRFFGPHGPSRAVTAMLGGKLYISGYPNGELYAYDPASAWTGKHPNTKPGENPNWLGGFTGTRTKYARGLAGVGARIYYVGKRERDGIGAGIGYYDTQQGTFAGTHEGLEWLDPTSIAVVGNELVIAGKPTQQTTGDQAAQLAIFDTELHSKGLATVKAGMAETGQIFGQPDGTVVGIARAANAIYRFDVKSRSVVGWKDIGVKIGATAEHADGTIWMVAGGRLARLDPATLELVTFGTSELPDVEHLEWLGDDLYASVGSALWRIRRVGLP